MLTDHSLSLDLDEHSQMYPAPTEQSSLIRKLALAVIEHAIHQATHPRVCWSKTNSGINGVAGDPVAWLSTWDLVEPWCLVAEIPVGRLKRRIESVTAERMAA
jgi:hypothetical protein